MRPSCYSHPTGYFPTSVPSMTSPPVSTGEELPPSIQQASKPRIGQAGQAGCYPRPCTLPLGFMLSQIRPRVGLPTGTFFGRTISTERAHGQ